MNDINLLPKEYKKSFRHKWYVAGGVITGILVALALSFVVYQPIYEINIAQVEQIDLGIKLDNNMLEEVRIILKQIDVFEQEKKDIEHALEQMGKPSDVSRKTLDIIVANAPNGIQINQLTIDNSSKTIIIRGNAKDIINVAQYMATLYNIGQFKEISYVTSQNNDVRNMAVDYELKIHLKPLLGEGIDGEIEGVLEVEDLELEGAIYMEKEDVL